MTTDPTNDVIATPEEAVLVGRPPSLVASGLVRLTLSTPTGRPVRITRTGLRMLAGQRLRLAVTVDRQGPAPPVVHFGTHTACSAVFPPQAVTHATETVHTAELRAESRGRLLPQFIQDKLPLPTVGEISLQVVPADATPVTMIIPVVVMPAWWSLVFTGLLGVGLVYLSPKFFAALNRHDDIWSAVRAFVDLPGVVWLNTVALVGVIVLGGRLFGECLTLLAGSHAAE